MQTVQCSAAQCNALQCAAVRCNVLQRTATYCNTLLHWGVGSKPKIVHKRDPSVSNSAWKAFFRWTWTSILLPENWVSWISPNIWRYTVAKWTHRLMKEADNRERSLYCACWGCYPRLSGGERDLIKGANPCQNVLAFFPGAILYLWNCHIHKRFLNDCDPQKRPSIRICWSMLQCAAVCCSVMQCVAVEPTRSLKFECMCCFNWMCVRVCMRALCSAYAYMFASVCDCMYLYLSF